jgi:hypothetical protein
VSLAALAGIEQGKGKPRGSTMAAVQEALEHEGIEFTPDPGVRLRREKFDLHVFEGDEAVPELWADIERALGTKGGEVLISGADDARALADHTKERLAQALKRQRDMKIYNRILICEGNHSVFIGPEAYRTVPRMLFQQAPYYVYADRLALINRGPPYRIIIIQNALIAETFRRQFEFNWQIGRELDPQNTMIISLGMTFEKHLPVKAF